MKQLSSWIVTSSLILVLALPGLSLAQRRVIVHRPPVRTVVTLGLGWGYPYPAFGFYDPYRGYDPFWGSWYPSRFGPYGSPYQYPVQPYGYAGLTGAIRLDVTPKQAEVYVDGYRAGVVDDFDGVFQRLNIRAGQHDLVLYLDGYRSLTQHLYVNPGSDQRIRLTMVALGSGEAAEMRPQPTSPPQSIAGDPMRGDPRAPMRAAPESPSAPAKEAAKFGTLSLRVVPANADIWIDGERWRNPNALAPLVVQLTEGKHKVEISQPNYERYSNEIEIQVGETQTVNVSLKRLK